MSRDRSGEGNGSDDSGNSQNQLLSNKTKVKRTKPNCNKCKNHGITAKLAGHKRYCRFQKCMCQPCLLTEERRGIMAAQTRQKRAQVQDEYNKVPYSMRAPVPQTIPPVSPISHTSRCLSSPPLSPPSPSPEPPRIVQKRTVTPPPVNDVVESARRLIYEFGMKESVLPFAIVILKKIGQYDRVSDVLLQIQAKLLDKTMFTASLVHDRPSLSLARDRHFLEASALQDRSLGRMIAQRGPIFAVGPNYVPEVHSSPFKMYTDPCGAIPLIHPNRVQ